MLFLEEVLPVCCALRACPGRQGFRDLRRRSPPPARRFRMGLCITHPGPRSGPRSAQWQETDRRRRDPGLPVEPDVLVPPAVVDAVHHDGDALDLRLPAPGTDGVEDDRPGHGLLQPAVSLPDPLLALLPVGFRRLLVEPLFQFLVAVGGVVAPRETGYAWCRERVW